MKNILILLVILLAHKMQAQVAISAEEQITQLNAAIIENPDDDKLYSKRAYLYFSQNKKELALADVSKAVNLNRENYNAYFLYGYISLEKGDLSSAYFYANEAIKYNPTKDPKFYLVRAFGNEGRHKLQDAISDFKTVVELEPNNEDAKKKIAFLEAELKKEAIAKEALKKEGENATLVTKIITHKESEYNATMKNCEELTTIIKNKMQTDKSININHASLQNIKKQYKANYRTLIKISDERIALCPADLQTNYGNLATALTTKRNSFVSDWLKLTGEDIFK